MLGRKLGPVDSAVFVTTGVASGLAWHWTGPITAVQYLLVLAILEFAVQPISTLLHELGHAVAAKRLGGRDVFVVVGRGPWATLTIGGVRVNFSPLPSRGVLIRGFCSYNQSEVSWRSRAWIALAGPAATFLTLILAFGFGADAWPGSGAMVRYLIVLSVLGLLLSMPVNLLPLRRDGRDVANDGAKARAAFRLASAGAPLRLDRRRDRERAATSVPPPR